MGRNDRQQRMLFAVYDQMREQGTLASIPRIYAAVRSDVYTNLSAAQIAALAAFGLDLGVENIRRSTLEGAYVHDVYNASYYVLENKKLIALVENEFGVAIQRESKYDLARVKRDKAAAEARRAAESTPEIEAMAVIPADSTGDYARELLSAVRIASGQLETALDSGASYSEILRLRHRLNVAVAAFLKANGAEGGVPDAFSMLVKDDRGV